MSLSRSRTPSPSVQVGVDSDTEVLTSSPSPPPTAVSEECYRSSHAVFIRCWNRGENCCSRCDFEYHPVSNTRHAYHRSSESVKSSKNNAKINTPGPYKPHKQMDVKKEEKLSPVLKKRPAPESCGSDAQIVSSLMTGAQPALSSDSTALRAYLMMHDPTPALRQLSEYARPHLGDKQDMLLPTNQGLLVPGVMPYPHGDVSFIQRHQARERLEELERRTHAGYKDDVKPVRDWPTASASVMTGLQLPPVATAAARDLPLAELQRLYGPSFLPPGSGLGAVPPQTWYQSPDLAVELLQRERQHLEQLAGAGAGAVHAVPGYHAAAATVDPTVRVPAADRLNMSTDPLLRLQLASAGLGTGSGPVCAGDGTAAVGVSAGEMSHTHTHSHTHLHLHQPDSTSAAAASLFPPLHPVIASQLLQSSALNLPVDPVSATVNPASAVHRSVAAYGSSVPALPLAPVTPAVQCLAAAQQQELLYHELLSRTPYGHDPALVQQLLAEAAAMQEASRIGDREMAFKLPR